MHYTDTLSQNITYPAHRVQ